MKNIFKKGLVVVLATLFVTSVFAAEATTTTTTTTPAATTEKTTTTAPAEKVMHKKHCTTKHCKMVRHHAVWKRCMAKNNNVKVCAKQMHARCVKNHTAKFCAARRAHWKAMWNKNHHNAVVTKHVETTTTTEAAK